MSWTASRLGDVLTLKRGHDLPDSLRQDGDVPVVSSSGITGRHSEHKATAPGVVTGREVRDLAGPHFEFLAVGHQDVKPA